MRGTSSIPALFLLALAGPATAAEIAIGGPYGNEAGCALLANAANIPPGIGLIVMPAYIATEQTVCRFETAERTPAGEWRVGAHCIQNQEIEYDTDVLVSERSDRSGVTVTLLSQQGPEGIYAACTPLSPAGAPL